MGEVKGPIVSDKKPSGQTSRVGRPLYENPDGSYYSEVTVTFPFEGKWLTFPSVDEYGNILSEDEVFEYVKKNGPVDPITGETFPVFETLEDAESFARDRSKGLIDFNEGGLVSEDKTLEAFGMTREEMEQANQQAADQMLPVPYDIPGEVGPVKEDRFGDTAAWAAKDSWEEAKARFQSRGTEEGVAGAIPDADSSILNTFAAGLGYAADMGLSGLAASDAAWRYSVGLASELVPGMDKNQEQQFTRDVSSIPEAFSGNITGVVGGIDRLPDVRQATTGARMAAEDVLDAMPEYDPNKVNIFGGLGSRDPGYDRSGGRLPESVGADGQYRFEIDDSPMVVVGSNIKTYESVPKDLTRLPQDTSKLGDVMVHDEFFSQYPELKDISVFFNSSMESNHLGTARTYPGPNGTQKQYLELNPQMLLGEPELLKRVLIHEIQHAVQDREGFAAGTSSRSKEVRERAAFEIESPENVEIWNQYTKDLENFRRPENLVAPLEAAKDFILAYSDKNGIRLRDPNFLDRLKDRFTGREESIVEGNLKVMLNSIELSLDNIKSGYGVNFDHYRGGLDSLYRKLGSIVGKEDKDLFRGIVGFSPDVINPTGWGSDFDAMEYFTEVPLLPDLPAPGTDKLSGIPENLLYSIYRRKRGEVEAENAAIRAEMSLQERFDTSPEDTELTGQGIARSQQWGDPYNSGGSNSSQIRQETNPREFNEGGLAMERQMNTMMAEGGIKDSGMNRDPVSGNEIPAGSLAKEVRDDVDAKLSEGEYVVPADVVRYFGVNYFEKLRQKAKAGLEEMEKDGRIGGDPVDEQMGSMMDDDLPFSDEELMSIDDGEPIEMNEGGAVSAFNPTGFQPGYSSGQGLATQTKTFINAKGEVRSVLYINGQPIQQIPEGFVEDTPENRAKFAESEVAAASQNESSSDKDRDRSVQVSQTTGDSSKGFSLGEDDLKSLSENPLAFGMDALEGNFLGTRGLSAVGGALAGPVGAIAGMGYGVYSELQDLAKVRAAKLVAESKGLTDSPEYAKLVRKLEAREDGMSPAAKFFDKGDYYSGKDLAASITNPAPTTPQAIPTSGIVRNNAGIDTAKAMTPAQVQAGQAKADRGDDRPNTWDGGQVASNQDKPDRDRSKNQARKAAQRAADRQGSGSAYRSDGTVSGSGKARGGLIQRPKKKPVAKK